ncbi:MAG: ribosome maturation factor RimP [bacterium]|nr:ribosome maturation factor RimP [bacterium]
MNEDLERLLEAEVRREGFDLYQWSLRPGQRRRTLQVYIHSSEGVKLDDCVRISRSLGPLIEEADIIQGAYVLEVSSSGVDRTLTSPRHYELSLGERLRVVIKEGDGDTRTIEGILKSLEDEVVLLATGQTEERLPLATIHRAQVLPELVMRRKKTQSPTEECDE